jgi:DNA-binding response OmpR family regulator
VRVATASILVVDDERDLTELVRLNLEMAGHQVRTAGDGAQALAAIREQRPDLVLLDVMMPVLDGWGVLQALQEDPELRDLPVVMLTALSGERDVIRGHLSGALRYLTKPFDVHALLGTIEEALLPETDEQRRRRREQLRGFLQRLAELETGRRAAGTRVAFSRLEAPPRPPTPEQRSAALLADLTPRQREIATLLAEGVEARAIADRLGTSRSNVYAARKRIARHLGVEPDDVARAARELGLAPR